MVQLDRRQFLRLVGLGSAVALLPPPVTATNPEPGPAFKLGDPDSTLEVGGSDEPYSVTGTIQFDPRLKGGRYALVILDDCYRPTVLWKDGVIDEDGVVEIPIPKGHLENDNIDIQVRAMHPEHAAYVTLERPMSFFRSNPGAIMHIPFLEDRIYANP